MRRSATRLDAVEETLRAVKVEVGALGELSARLAQTVQALEGEIGVLAEQARSEADEASGVSEAQLDRSKDLDGARLVALNMALNGDSREETARYLDENFDVPDRERLLDEVYAAIEG
jgi:nitrogenase molybdenum-iron protein alpha/beta subunit